MTTMITDATNWAVGQVATYPKKIMLKAMSGMTDAAIDKLFPNQKESEACKFLKEVAPEILLILGDSLYQKITHSKPSTTPDATATDITTAEQITNRFSRETLKKILMLVHDRL